MSPSSLLSRFLLPAALCALAPAQIYVPLLSSKTPFAAQVGGQCNSRTLALAPDGRYWALVRDASVPNLELRTSTKCGIDQPANWTKAADILTTQDGSGAIVMDPDCCTLHVLWHAFNGGPWVKVYYQTFDVCTGLWNGTPTQVSPAADTWNYFAFDIEVTPQGQVVAAYENSSPWSAWIVELPSGTAQKVSTDNLGWGLNMQAVHETIHMSFRTGTGGYGIRYRAYDTCSDTFLSPTDLPVRSGTSNVSHIAADGCGGIYIMSADASQMYVDYDPNPGAAWVGTNLLTVADSGLGQGNVTFCNYTLCAGPGNKIYALWSLASGSYSRLDRQDFDNGAAIGTPVLGTLQPTDSFRVLSGFRSTQSASGIVGLIGNQNPLAPWTGGSQVAFAEYNPPSGPPYGRRTTKYGTPCNCGCNPIQWTSELDAWELPNAAPLSIDLKVLYSGPPSVAVLIIGIAPLHIDLSTLGSGCGLYTSPIVSCATVIGPSAPC